MRIAFFHELPEGGARIVTNEIAERLKKNYQVDLYYVDKQKSTLEHQNYNNVQFFRFIPRKWYGNDWKSRVYKDTVELLKLYNLHKKIAGEIDSQKYDVVFVNASKFIEAPFILRFLKTKSIFYLHDPHFRVIYESILNTPKKNGMVRYSYEKIHMAVLKKLDRENYQKANFIIANSFYTQQTALKSYGRESIVCYLGVDTNFFKPGSVKKNIDILYIGSRDVLDGYLLLEQSLKHLNSKSRIRTIFKDEVWIDRKSMRDLYQRSKIVVCFGMNEPFGLIAIEAMSCACSVIAVDEAGYKETVLNNKTGYLVPRIPKVIAEKINYLFSHPKTLEQFGQEGRKAAVGKWDWEKRIKTFEEQIKNLI